MENTIRIAETIDNNDMVKMAVLFVNKTFAVSRKTMLSASRLFKKCAKIGTRILSVFRYRIAMQIEKMNAEQMLPKPCIDAKSSDEINIENVIGTMSFNLFNRTPLKINSSEIGEMSTVATNPPIAMIELLKHPADTLKLIKEIKPGHISKI